MNKPIKKTSNPIYTEGRDNQGIPPTPPKTDSMFDRRKQEDLSTKKPSNNNSVNGQKNTGHPKRNPNGITDTQTNLHEGVKNMYIYFETPGDYQGK